MVTPSVPTIRQVPKQTLPDVIEVHSAAFPEQALTLLGTDCLVRYYETLLSRPNESACTGVFLDGQLRGFIVAGVFHTTLLGFLRRNLVHLAVLCVRRPLLFLNAMVVSRVFAALRVMPRLIASRIRPSRTSTPGFRVLVLAVHPAFRRRGLGKLLMDACEENARSLGFKQIGLSVRRQNREAVHFYEALGWQRHLVNGVWTTEMTRDLYSPEIGSH